VAVAVAKNYAVHRHYPILALLLDAVLYSCADSASITCESLQSVQITAGAPSVHHSAFSGHVAGLMISQLCLDHSVLRCEGILYVSQAVMVRIRNLRMHRNLVNLCIGPSQVLAREATAAPLPTYPTKSCGAQWLGYMSRETTTP
jgi:hypothetical protein